MRNFWTLLGIAFILFIANMVLPVTWLLTVGAAIVVVLMSVIRWFEQTTDAVDTRRWNRLAVLILCPFAVWFFESPVAAGRPTPFPRHEPVRGFGTAGGAKPQPAPVQPSDQPPPGTPAEFLGMPKIPPPRPRTKSAVDPELMEKLKKKMRDQGMLPPE